MPVLKFNAESPKGTIVMHGGFDSSYEEFFSECEYLRERGYDVYLFEGPGQGECIRLYGAPAGHRVGKAGDGSHGIFRPA